MSGRILSREALDHILDTYATQGAVEAKTLAVSYGVKPSYVTTLAKTHGVRVKFKHTKKPPRGPDPRWQWAVERGSVVA